MIRYMQVLSLQQYLAVGAIMFVIGLIGFVTRRNLIVIFLCTELMFQGVAINLIAFSRYTGNLAGQAFVIFVLVIAAAEASLALGLGGLLFRTKNTLDADAWRDLKGYRLSVKDNLFAIKYSYLTPLLPLLGAMIAGFA